MARVGLNIPSRHVNAKRISIVIKRDNNPLMPGAWRTISSFVIGALGLTAVLSGVWFIAHLHEIYTIGWQSPVVLHFRSPVVVARRTKTQTADQARHDQVRPLSSYQEYACQKFGPACRVALAIQRAENPQGKCEIYHYNQDGTLDWGYFQINTVHLKRRGVNLRDLLDCRANIDFAYQLYKENQGFASWSTYKSGRYRRFLR